MHTKIEIDVRGDTQGDVIDAISEVRRLLMEGFICGADRNATGQFNFHTTDVIPESEAAVFVRATAIVPADWGEWFWAAISENAPFSWGDNNRTLVTASRFREHCASAFSIHEIEERVTEEFMHRLYELGETYIDLEN